MGFGNCVLVNDTASNMEVIGAAGFSYNGKREAQDLSRQLQMLLNNPALVAEFRLKAEERARANYRWEAVVRDHLALYSRLLGVA
jgi:glycosyltransferase involved in cell wall biosynthesis